MLFAALQILGIQIVRIQIQIIKDHHLLVKDRDKGNLLQGKKYPGKEVDIQVMMNHLTAVKMKLEGTV